MALQTQNLVMVGLGIEADSPPNQVQPCLVDGIHLRWAFKRELGFPWYGFYLFRRPHQAGKTLLCLSEAMAVLTAGQTSSPSLSLTTPVGQVNVSSDTNLVLTNSFPANNVAEFDLSNRNFLRVTLPPGEPAHRVEVRLGFQAQASVSLTALFGETPVIQQMVSGKAGQVVLMRLEFDTITAVEIGPGAAALVDFCFTPISQEATLGWQPLADFPYSMRLPVSQPDYPCTAGQAEALAQARKLAYKRILYGDPELFTGAPVPLYTEGKISVVKHSPIVIGKETKWTDAWVGAALQVENDPTAYTIAMVVAPDKLVLSRGYTGDSGTGMKYAINYDNFGQLHDHLVHLVMAGSAAGSMAERFLPLPIEQAGTIKVTHGERIVSGSGLNWTPELTGLALQVAGEPAIYTIVSVEGATDLILDREYQGDSGDGKAYTITSRLQATEPGRAAPRMPRQCPLDLVLLGALHPAVAQMVGLYWVDQTAQSEVAYDYLIVADYTGRLGFDPKKALTEIQRNGFKAVEGYIVFNRQRGVAKPPVAPGDLRVYALPASTLFSQKNEATRTSNQAGLCWEVGTTNLGVLLPGKPLMYHLWRASLGNEAQDPDNPPPDDRYELITPERPLLLALPQAPPGLSPQRPPDWPPGPLQFIDRGLDEGWYSYQVSGLDIFGRHSKNSDPGRWYQWTPAPTPRPWYYRDPPADTVVHPFAVCLLDKLPPPAPTGVEAYALDPADPTVLNDEAHQAWRASLGPAMEATAIGLRLRWLWTEAHMRQAPDTHEFRIYFHRGSNPPANPGVALNWQERFAIVGYGENVSVTTDAAGRPLRCYEVFLLAPEEGFSPSLAEPVVYAHLGISAADDKTHTPDDPAWQAGGNLGGRFGNEGPVGPPAKLFLVNRQPPPPPIAPAEAERVYATPADYHGHSFYTYRWQPLEHVKTHIFRALDDALFKVDWALRPRGTLTAIMLNFFPTEATDPRWNAAKRHQVATALNPLNNFGHDATGTAQAMAYYRSLSDDALRVLAGLPGNERAFSQRTLQPLNPADPANANRSGPDNPADFPLDPALCAYVDTLDGRSTNRYFYRAVYLDGAHNRSSLSLASPPVYLPKVTPPRTPVIAKVLGGDRQISLTWAANRETDLAEYRVYRADNEAAARDLRLMTLAHTEAVPPGDPATRPAQVTWTDPTPAPLTFWYRLTAVDGAGNESAPSTAVKGRSYRASPPAAPTWISGLWQTHNGSAFVRLTWSLPEALEVLVQRRRSGTAMWGVVANWLPQGTSTFDDTTAEPAVEYVYRLKGRDVSGRQSEAGAAMLVPVSAQAEQ